MPTIRVNCPECPKTFAADANEKFREHVLEKHPGWVQERKLQIEEEERAITLDAELEAAQDDLARLHKLIDQYLPTIVVGLQEIVYDQATMHKSRDELTPEEVGLRAALSAAHSLVKHVAGYPLQAEPIYDLPSVQDLLRTRKESDKRAQVAALMDAARDAVFSGIPGFHEAQSQAAKEAAVLRWLEDRATRISREREA